MLRRSGLSVLFTLAFLATGPAFALAHPYPVPHTHQLTKGLSETKRTFKKPTGNATRQLAPHLKTNFLPIPKLPSADRERKAPSTSPHNIKTAPPSSPWTHRGI